MRLTRRGLLAGAASLVALPALASTPPALPPDALADLTQIARDLFPMKRIDAAPYARAAAALLSQPLAEARTANWRAALDGLNGGSAKPWRNRPAPQRIEALRAIATLPAFADWRASFLVALYHDADVARAIGFPGPSAPFGGYLDNGVGDIDWLAEPTDA
jgi:hypothetical protein